MGSLPVAKEGCTGLILREPGRELGLDLLLASELGFPYELEPATTSETCLFSLNISSYTKTGGDDEVFEASYVPGMTSSPKTGSSKTREDRKDGTLDSIVFSAFNDGDGGGSDDDDDDDDDDASSDATNLGGPPNTSS